MDLEETLMASRAAKGPLGAITFAVLTGLRAGGASADEVAATQALLDRTLRNLSDADCDVLVEVVDQRLGEAKNEGRWYDSVRLAGRLNAIEAHITHDALVQQGIDTRIRHEHLSGGDIPNPGMGVELWVRPRDLERAKEIMVEVQKAPEARTVACPHCGEDNPAHFASCWSCGDALVG